MTPAAAAALGQDALVWLASRPDDLGALLAASGMAPDEIRARAADPEFLGFVLDFLLQSDELILGFAAEAGLPPDAPARARAALPGGETPNWT